MAAMFGWWSLRPFLTRPFRFFQRVLSWKDHAWQAQPLSARLPPVASSAEPDLEAEDMTCRKMQLMSRKSWTKRTTKVKTLFCCSIKDTSKWIVAWADRMRPFQAVRPSTCLQRSKFLVSNCGVTTPNSETIRHYVDNEVKVMQRPRLFDEYEKNKGEWGFDVIKQQFQRCRRCCE